jgi:hypothetical protein
MVGMSSDESLARPAGLEPATRDLEVPLARGPRQPAEENLTFGGPEQRQLEPRGALARARRRSEASRLKNCRRSESASLRTEDSDQHVWCRVTE